MITTLNNIDKAIKQAYEDGERSRANYLSMLYFELKYEGQAVTSDQYRPKGYVRQLRDLGLDVKESFRDEDKDVQYYKVKVVE